jgi:opacity protein-like surface antigen
MMSGDRVVGATTSVRDCKLSFLKSGRSFMAEKRMLGHINKERRVRAFLPVLLALLAVPLAFSQAQPTAVKNVPLSFFGGVTGVYTGLSGGKNLSITAGTDLRLRDIFGLAPSVEVRGTYPVDRGQVASQKNILAGFRVGRSFGSFTPYGDVLFGLGQLNYSSLQPNPSNTFAYSYSSSNVYSAGAGVDFDVTPSWGIKADGQFQRYSTPVTESGHIYIKSLTLGVVYHLFGGSGPR